MDSLFPDPRCEAHGWPMPCMRCAEEGERLRNEAIRQVEAAAKAEFLREGLSRVREVALNRDELTTDDIWPRMESTTHEPRAMGPVMVSAKKAGWIATTGRVKVSNRPQNHRRKIDVWASLIRPPTPAVYDSPW